MTHRACAVLYVKFFVLLAFEQIEYFLVFEFLDELDELGGADSDENISHILNGTYCKSPAVPIYFIGLILHTV